MCNECKGSDMNFYVRHITTTTTTMSNNHQESPSDHLVTSSEAVVSKIMIELQQVNSMLKEQMERQKAQTDILSSLVAGFDVQRQNTVLFGDDDDDGDGDEMRRLVKVEQLFRRVLHRVQIVQDFGDVLDPGFWFSSLDGLDGCMVVCDGKGEGVGVNSLSLKTNSKEIMCPYELNGICKDEYCKFWHMEQGGYYRSKISSADIRLPGRTYQWEQVPQYQYGSALKEARSEEIEDQESNDDMSISTSSSILDASPQQNDSIACEVNVRNQSNFFEVDDEFISLPPLDKEIPDNDDESDSTATNNDCNDAPATLPLHELLQTKFSVDFQDKCFPL